MDPQIVRAVVGDVDQCIARAAQLSAAQHLIRRQVDQSQVRLDIGHDDDGNLVGVGRTALGVPDPQLLGLCLQGQYLSVVVGDRHRVLIVGNLELMQISQLLSNVVPQVFGDNSGRRHASALFRDADGKGRAVVAAQVRVGRDYQILGNGQ